MMMQRRSIRELDHRELSDVIAGMGEKSYRAGQIYEWVHKKNAADFDVMSNISLSLREKLKDEFILDPLNIVKRQDAGDGSTSKFLFSLPDGETIESVWMHYRHGDSICVSSQVGCRMGCKFCASTIDGLSRNLTAGEMLSQVYDIEREMYRGEGRISGIIIMGMGEPFDNYDNVIKFIRLLSDEAGRNLSARHITISTCGIVEGINKLAAEELPLTLAFSLHAPNDELRKRIMPIANAYPLDRVIAACKGYFEKTGRRLTFEYSMMRGVNDDKHCAKELAGLCRELMSDGVLVHVNLIPLNEVRERELARSDRETIDRFKIILEKNRINVTIRREMGSEIDAACGQLRRDNR